MNKSLTKRFEKLFVGHGGTYGQWNPTNGNVHTEKIPITTDQFSRHLNGDYGLGRVPILEDDTCMWGAIDIDCHGEGEYINIEEIARIIFARGLPLIPCRSKSGGVHCYVFTSEPVPAVMIKRALQQWATAIGYAGSEIFPKQSQLRDNQNGNWINLPYFEAKNTNRYALNSAKDKLSLEQFIEAAESFKLNSKMLKSFILAGHEQAPPCLQELLIEGVPKGYRNEALYAFTVYFRKKLPASGYRQAVLEINEKIFEQPLPLSEANRSIISASRREYRYKCKEEPCRTKCDSKTCISREYGIEESDSFETGEAIPDFTRLRVFNTEPPLWELTVNDEIVIVSTPVIRNFALLAEEIMNRLLIVVPILKPKDWMPMLSALMQDVERIEAPDNASVEGIIREKLTEFISRADFNSNGKDKDDRNLLDRGLPVMQEIEGSPGKREVMFKGADFISFLKRTRSEELKGNALWMALRKMGVKHGRTRMNGSVKNIWTVPVDGKGRTKLDYDYDPNSVFIHTDPEKVVRIMNKINF